MKRVIVLLALTIFLLVTSSCAYKGTPGDLPDSEEIMNEFRIIALDTPEKIEELSGFVDQNIIHVDSRAADEMILTYEETQKNYMPTLEERFSDINIQIKFQEEDDFKKNLNNYEVIDDPVIKDLVKDIRNKGYKIERTEGSYFPIIDYSFYSSYSNYSTPEVKEYISIMITESNEDSMKDAALIISWKQLVERALAQEKYIAEYPDGDRTTLICELFERYRYAVFYGLPNTPLFKYDTKHIDEDAKKAYEEAIETSSKSELLDVLAVYLRVISENDDKLTETVENFRKTEKL